MMYPHSPVTPVIIIMILFLMSLDAQILATVVCIPTGILMLRQCRQSGEENTEDSAKYDPLAVVGGAGMLFFGLCIMINYIFK